MRESQRSLRLIKKEGTLKNARELSVSKNKYHES